MTTIRMSANAAAGPRGCPEMRVCAVVIAHSPCRSFRCLSSANALWPGKCGPVELRLDMVAQMSAAPGPSFFKPSKTPSGVSASGFAPAVSAKR
jgi:hypothetical protein